MSLLTQIISGARIILLPIVNFLSLFFLKVSSNQNVFGVSLTYCSKQIRLRITYVNIWSFILHLSYTKDIFYFIINVLELELHTISYLQFFHSICPKINSSGFFFSLIFLKSYGFTEKRKNAIRIFIAKICINQNFMRLYDQI